jgi:predicted O-methyltransferase YrrM
MSRLEQFKRYLAFRKGSLNRHGVHSPFVFELIEQVLRNKKKEPVFMDIEKRRARLLKDETSISMDDPGAGSSTSKSERRVKDVARLSLSSPDQCRILYRLVEHFKPETLLEFGSCMGISTSYLAKAHECSVFSMEGHPELYRICEETKKELGLHVNLKKGLFQDILLEVLANMGKVDMAFVDGHHTEEATLQYFDQLKPHIHEDSVLIFDDIHWSEGMERAWEEIKSDQEVTLSIDLFWCGIVFFKKGLSGEHFKLRY